MPHFFLFLFSLLSLGLSAQELPATWKAAGLDLKKIAAHTYIHTSYLETEKWGDVPCNGAVYCNNGEALIIDTPVSDEATALLIDWLEKDLKLKVVGVLATHFHVDCVAGLPECHKRSIPTYSLKHTCTLSTKSKELCTQRTFSEKLDIKVGQQEVSCRFFGEGHTADNIVAWLKQDQVLFGGCLIKTMGAGKGNLSDANTNQWSETVKKVKAFYPDLKVVIPGHGKEGGSELLDYTIQLFAED